VAHDYNRWLRSVIAYTIAGCGSAVLVGMVLAGVGRLLIVRSAVNVALCLIALIALVLAAREWGWITFRIPECRRQTQKIWAHEFGFVMASAMWGLHIGLGLATRITYGGFWVVVAIAVAAGDLSYGALLMTMYWFGRVLPLWIAPTLVKDSQALIRLPEAMLENRPLFHRLVGFALMWSAVIVMLFFFKGSLLIAT